MAARYDVRAVRVLRIFCPVEADTLSAMLAGDATAVEHDRTLARMLSIIRSGSPLGDFGIYKSVVEVSPGWELFTPGEDAEPTLGEADTSTTSPTAILTIYVSKSAPDEAVERAIEALVEAHPWEIPVIELSETSLVTRVGATKLDR